MLRIIKNDKKGCCVYIAAVFFRGKLMLGCASIQYFKTNPYLERGLMTGITRVSKESIFSDLNNLKVVTTTSDLYADCFGFTEEEVFRALDEQGMDSSQKEKVKEWYDGFTFGNIHDIYNPWSVTSFLDEKKTGLYWVNTSGNGLVNKLLQEGDPDVKMQLETLFWSERIGISTRKYFENYIYFTPRNDIMKLSAACHPARRDVF